MEALSQYRSIQGTRRRALPMKRPLFNAAWGAATILLANGWLFHLVSTLRFSHLDHSSEPIGQTVLAWALVLPQIPSFIASKLLTDAFGLSTFLWIALTSAASMLVYCPLIYGWSQRRAGAGARPVHRRAVANALRSQRMRFGRPPLQTTA